MGKSYIHYIGDQLYFELKHEGNKTSDFYLLLK